MKYDISLNRLYYHELKGLGFSVVLGALICFLTGYGATLLNWINTGRGKLSAMFLMAALVIAVAINMLHLARSISRTDGTSSKINY